MKSPKALVILLFLALATPAFGQTSPTDQEVRIALATWNDRASHADLNAFMQLFDDSRNLLVVGSDSGEVLKAKQHSTTGWLDYLLTTSSLGTCPIQSLTQTGTPLGYFSMAQ